MTFREQLAKLIDVKTLVTLPLVGATIYGFIAGKIGGEVFIPIVATVLAYFFTKKPAEKPPEV